MSAFGHRAYALRRAIAMLGQRPGRFLIGLLLATAALALPLLVLAMAYTAAPWISRVQVGPEVSIFVKAGTAPTEIEELRARLAASAGVTNVRLIPREQAYAELVRRSSIAAASGENANPLPDVLVARFEWTRDPATIERAAATARQWPGVDAVQADLQWYRRLIAGGHAVAMPMLALATLSLALVFLALTAAAATQVELRRDEAELLTMLGARRAFIVRPYAYASALTLALASVLALALATIALALTEPGLAGLADGSPDTFRWREVPAWTLGLAIIGTAAFGGLVGAFASRRHIRRNLAS
jgi:cell division transport system permease protein